MTTIQFDGIPADPVNIKKGDRLRVKLDGESRVLTVDSVLWDDDERTQHVWFVEAHPAAILVHPSPKESKAVSDYYCNHCGKTVRRDSDKRWIRSLCGATGKMTRLWRAT